MTVFTRSGFDAFSGEFKGNSLHDQWESRVAKVGGKVYAVFSEHEDGPATLAFKCSQETFEILTALAGVTQAPYFAKRQWVSVSADADLPEDEVRAYIANSHRLVAAGLTKAQRAEIGL
ncbi:MmcQ/YjbR family DNA-binding protein [Pelagibacterium sp. 26DY04]|nr:MmcQ/YjbR family DNA-binding protein [Pelagibacterium sp. 26DY04]